MKEPDFKKMEEIILHATMHPTKKCRDQFKKVIKWLKSKEYGYSYKKIVSAVYLVLQSMAKTEMEPKSEKPVDTSTCETEISETSVENS